MKRSRFSEEQIIGILREAEGESTVKPVAGKDNVSEATLGLDSLFLRLLSRSIPWQLSLKNQICKYSFKFTIFQIQEFKERGVV